MAYPARRGLRPWRWLSFGIIAAAVLAAYVPARDPATHYGGVWLAAAAAVVNFCLAAVILRRRPATGGTVWIAVTALLIAGFGVSVTGGSRSYEASLPFVMFFLVSATYPPRTSFLLGLLTAGLLVATDVGGGDAAYGIHRLVFQVPAVLIIGLYASLLYQDLNRERRQKRQMAEIAAAGRDLSALDVGAALSALVRHLQAMVRADEVAIYMREGDELVCAERWAGPAFGEVTRQPPTTRTLRMGEGLVGWAAAHRSSTLVPDTRKDPRVAAPTAFGSVALTCAVVPLLATRGEHGQGGGEAEVVGAVRVCRMGAGSLEPDDVGSLEVVAAQAALAIANARLFEQVRHQSLVDAATGLFNARYLERRLEDELARARRHRQPLTVAFIDSDSLKQVNDRFGHQRGDELVREIGAQIRRAIRAEDVPIRYAGDEFIVVMPDTAVEAAKAVLERLRLAVAGAGLAFEGIATTVSVGLAGYPDHADSAEDLIRLADHAMYAAKSGGKNQVAIWAGSGPI